MKKFDPKSAVRVVAFRLPFEEAEQLQKEFEASEYKKKVDFMRDICRRGLKSFKDS
jgi:pterin-4a-carbinolamine dehydratase|tara:strand:- start:112 stop:279 length:168 start_codon:yes stop_codon:yes gene_type:complete